MSRVPGLPSSIATKGGPVRRFHSATAPVCTKCGHNERVVRMWHGSHKVWVCLDHYPVTSTKRQEPTLAQRVLHRLPEAETFRLDEILPNRAARRRRK